MARGDTSFGRGKLGGQFPLATKRLIESVQVSGTNAQTAAQYGVFFTATDGDYGVTAVYERHATAGSDGSAVTCDVVVCASGTAKAAGTSVLSAPFDLKATADTNQAGTLAATLPSGLPTARWPAALRIPKGSSLALLSAGVLTAVVGVNVSVEIVPIQPVSII